MSTGPQWRSLDELLEQRSMLEDQMLDPRRHVRPLDHEDAARLAQLVRTRTAHRERPHRRMGRRAKYA